MRSEQADSFLYKLRPDRGAVETFQWIGDRDKSVTGIVHGPLWKVEDQLQRWNDRRCGIFVTVNQTDGTGRKTENIEIVRALFVDVDRPERPAFIQPSIVVSSGHGWHAYWVLEDFEALEDFTPAQKQLARFYQSDPSVTDLPRLMRLPGFVNWKREPVPVVMEDFEVSEHFTMKEVVSLHPVEPEVVHVPIVHGSNARAYAAWAMKRETKEGGRNRTAFSIAADGFKRGLPTDAIWEVVSAYCSRAGIEGEALAVFRSAMRRSAS